MGFQHIHSKWGKLFGAGPRGGGASGEDTALEDLITTLAPSLCLQADWGDIAALADSANVTTWDDQSANSLDVSEATNPPIYKLNQLNTSLPVVRFNGVSNKLTRAAVTGVTWLSANQGSFVAVLNQVGTKATNALLTWYQDINRCVDILASFNNSLYFDFATQTSGTGRVSVAQPTGWDDAWHIIECHRAADGTQSIVVDGAEIVSAGQIGTLTLAGTALDIVIGNLSTIFFQGDLYALYAFPTVLNPSQQAALRTQLTARTGINTSFP